MIYILFVYSKPFTPGRELRDGPPVRGRSSEAVGLAWNHRIQGSGNRQLYSGPARTPLAHILSMLDAMQQGMPPGRTSQRCRTLHKVSRPSFMLWNVKRL